MGLFALAGGVIGGIYAGPGGAAAGAGIGGSIDGSISGSKGRKADAAARLEIRKADEARAAGQRKILGIEQRIQEVQNRRSRIQSFKVSRQRDADALSSAAAGGVDTGSSAVSFRNNLTSGFAEELKNSLDIERENKSIFDTKVDVSNRTQTFFNIAGQFQNTASKERGRQSESNTISQIGFAFAGG